MHNGSQHESSAGIKRVLDRAWRIAREGAVGGERVILSSPALLFALCDASRDSERSLSLTTRFLADAMAERWPCVAEARAAFVAGTAHRETAGTGPHASPAAGYTLRIASMLAADRRAPRGMHLRDLLLALLLQPAPAGAIGAHAVLRSVGHEPLRLATRFQQALAEAARTGSGRIAYGGSSYAPA